MVQLLLISKDEGAKRTAANQGGFVRDVQYDHSNPSIPSFSQPLPLNHDLVRLLSLGFRLSVPRNFSSSNDVGVGDLRDWLRIDPLGRRIGPSVLLRCPCFRFTGIGPLHCLPYTLIQGHYWILEEHKVDQLDVTELTQLEHKLDAILRQTKKRKSQLMMKSVTALHEKRGTKAVYATRGMKKGQIAAPMDEATINDGSRDHLNHRQQMQGSFVDQELYGYSNTNQAAVPLSPFQQQEAAATFYWP